MNNDTKICQVALALAQFGFPVFPCKPGLKEPDTWHGHKDASTDPGQIRSWFNGDNGNRNLGIPTGVASNLLVIDADIYKPDAKASLDQLEAELGPLPETLTIETRAKGLQFYFQYPEGYDLRNSTSKLGDGIDIRGEGGYVVAVGSYVKGDDKGPAGRYKVKIKGSIAVLPAPWADAIEAISTKKGQSTGKDPHNDLQDYISGVGFVLPSVIPSGQRNDTLFRYKGHLLARGVPFDVVVQSVRDANAARCQPPLDEAELAKLLRPEDPPVTPQSGDAESNQSGQTTGQDTITGAVSDLDQAIARLNQTHFIAAEGGKVRVYIEGIDPERGVSIVTPYSKEDFKLLISDQQVRNGNDIIPLADYWLKSPKARRYRKGIALLPGQLAPPDVYNLWSGWGVEPKPGDHLSALKFIFQIICCRDKVVFEYVLGWMARAIQQPGEPAEVALVLRSPERGTGKGTFAKILCDTFGQHAMAVRSPKHLVGNFNAHLRNALLLFADEALFVGDRAGNEVLKGLITEPTIPIERKGVDVFSVKNRLKIIMATNSEWVIPASADERRFLILDVSPEMKQNHRYFGKFNNYLKKTGLSALLDYLLNYDISDFNIRAVPTTQGLIDQKNRSLDPFFQWLRERLWEGCLLPHDAGWKVLQSRGAIVEDYKGYVDQKHLRYVDTDASTIGRRLAKLFPGIDRAKRVRQPQGRIRNWNFPPLAEARRLFETHALGGDSLDWPPNDDDA